MYIHVVSMDVLQNKFPGVSTIQSLFELILVSIHDNIDFDAWKLEIHDKIGGFCFTGCFWIITWRLRCHKCHWFGCIHSWKYHTNISAMLVGRKYWISWTDYNKEEESPHWFPYVSNCLLVINHCYLYFFFGLFIILRFCL